MGMKGVGGHKKKKKDWSDYYCVEVRDCKVMEVFLVYFSGVAEQLCPMNRF